MVDDPAGRLHAELLRSHRAAGAPVPDQLVVAAQVSGGRVRRNALYDLLKGIGIPTQATLEAFVEACLTYARQHRLGGATAPYRDPEWQERLNDLRYDAERRRNQQRRSGPDREPTPATGGPSIRAWSPARLHVHRALNHANRADPTMPRYFRRPHDDRIDELLADVSESVVIVVVADTSAGKTRALYEAVSRHPVLATWPLAYPRYASALLARIGSVAPRTVLWLNDMENHIIGDRAEEAATALQELVSEPGRGPVVVLGTLWRRHWSATLDDRLPAVRDLFRHHTHAVEVPEAWSADELTRLLADPDTDPDLRDAAATAGQERRLVQTATGGPLLLDRYLRPVTPDDHYAQAALTAALDAHRLGHLTPLPPALLIDAAPAYLASRHRINPPDDWTRRGLRTALAEHLGVAALTEERTSAGVGPADGVVPHDYLVQHGTQLRAAELVPAELWESVARHTEDPEDLVRVGRAAEHRMQLEVAERCYRRAGSGRWVGALADFLDGTGRTADAVTYARAQADRDDPRALRWLGRHLRHSDDTDAALATAQRLVEISDSDEDLADLARLLSDAGRPDDALRHWLVLAESGHYRALDKAVDILTDREDIDGALAVLGSMPDHPMAQPLTNKVLRRAGRVQELTARYRDGKAGRELVDLLADRHDVAGLLALADDGDADALRCAVRLLMEAGDQRQATSRVRRWITLHNPGLWEQASLLDDTGHPDEALSLWLAADGLDPDNDDLQAVVARHLAAAGRIDDLRARAANPRDGRARRALADWLASHDGLDELHERAIAHDPAAAQVLSSWLVDHGRAAEAITLYTEVADADDRYALRELAQLHLDHGDPATARDLATSLARSGSKYDRRFLISVLRRLDDEAGLRDVLSASDDAAAAQALADLLAERGDREALHDLVLRGTRHAGWYLDKLSERPDSRHESGAE